MRTKALLLFVWWEASINENENIAQHLWQRLTTETLKLSEPFTWSGTHNPFKMTFFLFAWVRGWNGWLHWICNYSKDPLFRIVSKCRKPYLFLFVMQGYALLCVGFPSSDLEVETQDEDEVNCKFKTFDIERTIARFEVSYMCKLFVRFI